MENTRKFKCISHKSTRLMSHWVKSFTLGSEYDLLQDDIEKDGTIRLYIPGTPESPSPSMLWVDASCFEEVK